MSERFISRRSLLDMSSYPQLLHQDQDCVWLRLNGLDDWRLGDRQKDSLKYTIGEKQLGRLELSL